MQCIASRTTLLQGILKCALLHFYRGNNHLISPLLVKMHQSHKWRKSWWKSGLLLGIHKLNLSENHVRHEKRLMMQMRRQSALDVRVACALWHQCSGWCTNVEKYIGGWWWSSESRENNGRGHWREARAHSLWHASTVDSLISEEKLAFSLLYFRAASKPFVSRFAREQVRVNNERIRRSGPHMHG